MRFLRCQDVIIEKYIDSEVIETKECRQDLFMSESYSEDPEINHEPSLRRKNSWRRIR